MSDEHHHYVGALFVQFSDDEVWESHVWPPERWRHVSIRREDRMPSYRELKAMRARFFPADAEVIQVFPPEEEFVNQHPYCLHLWWNKDRRLCPSLAYGVGEYYEKSGEKVLPPYVEA